MYTLNPKIPDLAQVQQPRTLRFPFNLMHPGDNFTIPYRETKAAAVAARNWARRNNPSAKFVTRRDRAAGTALVIRVQ